MNFIETDIEGVFIVDPRVFPVARGHFFECWNRAAFEAAGLSYDFVQDNQSLSSRGTIRGLHFQKGKHAQAKLVRVIAGTVLDVAVDLRAGSPTFGRHVAAELSGENFRQLLIPRGFAHGFSVLSETAVFAYKCDNFYCREAEGGVRFDDPALGIDWRVPASERLLSDKDKTLPFLEDLAPCF